MALEEHALWAVGAVSQLGAQYAAVLVAIVLLAGAPHDVRDASGAQAPVSDGHCQPITVPPLPITVCVPIKLVAHLLGVCVFLYLLAACRTAGRMSLPSSLLPLQPSLPSLGFLLHFSV